LSLSLAFGTYTRRTGEGRCEPIVACTCTAISALAWLVSATSPSIPAVRRPVLRCVTCRTLTSVLLLLRSISFCKFLACGQSPSCAALKILPRSRRTCSSWQYQSTRSQASPSNAGRPSGPFTEVSNVPISSGIYARSRLNGPPAHVSALSSPGSSGPASGPVIREPSGRSSRSCGPAFLLPFGCPASALWAPCPAMGTQPPLRSAYRTACAYPRLGCGPIAGFTRSARVRPGPGRAPSIPRGQRCSLAIDNSVAAACRLSAAGPCHPGDTAQPGVLT